MIGKPKANAKEKPVKTVSRQAKANTTMGQMLNNLPTKPKKK